MQQLAEVPSLAQRIGIVGHQGLPPATRELVNSALHNVLARHGGDIIGITCLADGADQLFASAVLALGSRLEVIVPAQRYRDGLSPAAQPAYDQLFARAHRVERLPFVESTEEAHMAAGKLVVDRSDLLLAVWDGEPARGYGGTADVVAYAREQGVSIEVIWPEGARRD